VSTTGHIDMAAKQTSASIRIDADPETIFALLANPGDHHRFDGSGMVKGTISGPSRLTLGDKFAMSMKFGPLPYRISNKVVEFDQDRLIAWQHFGKHRWRYELEPIDSGTLVTETFDWSTALLPPAIEAAGYPKSHLGNIEQTLQRLKDVVETNATAPAPEQE